MAQTCPARRVLIRAASSLSRPVLHMGHMAWRRGKKKRPGCGRRGRTSLRNESGTRKFCSATSGVPPGDTFKRSEGLRFKSRKSVASWIEHLFKTKLFRSLNFAFSLFDSVRKYLRGRPACIFLILKSLERKKICKQEKRRKGYYI